MSPYEMIKTGVAETVPFATHTGVELISLGDGTATARLEQRAETENYIKGQHAGAIFTLGETTAGAAVAGALAPVILKMRPVASKAEVTYRAFAQGTLTATAKTLQSGADLLTAIEADGKVSFEVAVDIRNAAGDTVSEMTVQWHVSPMRG